MFFFENSEIVKRLKKYPVLEHFSLFSLNRLVDQSELIVLPMDQVLFHCGEVSDSVYYLMDGHLECFSSNDLSKKIDIIRTGEMVGETDVVGKSHRSMAVKTTRESQLLKINKDVFLKFFQKDPELLMLLAESMAKRIQQMVMGLQGNNYYPHKNIGIVVMSPDISIENIRKIFNQEALKDQVAIYDKVSFEDEKMEFIPFFYRCEENVGLNLFFANTDQDIWNTGVLDHVDYVYLITQENTAHTLAPHILARAKNRPVDIVILHPEVGPYPGTQKFYNKHCFKRHHHIMDIKTDIQRLYRYATGQAIGLVISGGGFRGFAHHGLIKALFEAKVPIDCIAGSSMGAAVGSILALKFDWENFDKIFTESMHSLKTARRALNFTLPIFSILSGRVATRLIKKLFKKYYIEDLSSNFFCAVSNLSETKKEIKKTGALWEWIRASISIPGVFPPFEKKGSVYVDGAVCTNLPVLDMREYLDGAGTIISCDLHIPPFQSKKYRFPPIWSFKTSLMYRLGFLKSHRYVVPSLIDVVMESSLINQSLYDMQGAKNADISLSPDTSTVGFSDVAQGESLSLMAYDLAKKMLKEKRELYKRWLE